MNAGKLMDDCGVQVKNNAKEIISLLTEMGYKNPHKYYGYCTNDSYYYIKNNRIECHYLKLFSKLYTLEEFKEIVNGNTIHECW